MTGDGRLEAEDITRLIRKKRGKNLSLSPSVGRRRQKNQKLMTVLVQVEMDIFIA